MKGRIIAIGDIHGCHQEFEELLQLIELKADDRLILLGDLINRGPDSHEVIQIAIRENAISLLGNHERRSLAAKLDSNTAKIRESEQATFDSLQTEDWNYLNAMLLTYEIKELNTVFVHGGFLPNQPWETQSADTITEIQVIDAEGCPRKRKEDPNALPWADHWNGPPYVVYGFTPRDEVYKKKWSLCLDTACAMGGQLTALILPERRIVQVKAKQRYHP